MQKPLVAGNWKMNGLAASLEQIDLIGAGIDDALRAQVDVMICPPSILVAQAVRKANESSVLIGGQDCHAMASGAHTGDVSAEMLKDAGASAVIVGHSERRADHGETDVVVKAKAEAALRAGLIAIICIGETRAQREAGSTLGIVGSQLAGSVPPGTAGQIVIAYEPVWAIGTGLVPSVADVAEVHAFVRTQLEASHGAEGAKMRILYGGSVKSSNARALMSVPHVNGALVGGASLMAADFLGIVGAYR